MQDPKTRSRSGEAASHEAAEANLAAREARRDRDDPTLVPVHPLTGMARPAGAGAAEDDDPEAVIRRVEGEERTG